MEIQVYWCSEWKMWGVCKMLADTSLDGEAEWFLYKWQAKARAEELKQENPDATVDIGKRY